MGREPHRQLLSEATRGLVVAGLQPPLHACSRPQHCHMLIHMALPCREVERQHPSILLPEMRLGMRNDLLEATGQGWIRRCDQFLDQPCEHLVVIVHVSVAYA